MRCHRSRKRRPCRSDGRTRFPQHDRSRGFDGRGVRTAAVQWRDLPERSGPWKTVYEGHRLWSADETWKRVLQQAQAQVAADAAGEIDWDISVDSTIVRAPESRRHPHQRGRNSRTPGRKAVAEPARPPGGGGGPGECLGRAAASSPKSIWARTAPSSHECWRKIRVPRCRPGRPRRKPRSVAADKAYSNRPCRQYLRHRGIRHTSHRHLAPRVIARTGLGRSLCAVRLRCSR
ncbi:transposase [Streptomyces rubiginosohelvolus]|uniref:transposase n=1 Tax=Streptomyces rubiginosohelvolus TaxID=67362 RepID=UPI0036EE8A57